MSVANRLANGSRKRDRTYLRTYGRTEMRVTAVYLDAAVDAHARTEQLHEVIGMPFVKCSCDPDGVRPQSAVWLREHWQGSVGSGVAALQKTIAHQASQCRACREGVPRELASCTCPAQPSDFGLHPADHPEERWL